MRKIHLPVIYTLIGVCLIMMVKYLFIDKKPEIYYVNNIELFNAFGMKKEYEAKLNTVIENRKNVLDSLSAILDYEMAKMDTNAEDTDIQKNRILYLQNNYREKQEEFGLSNSEIIQQFDNRIWERLNGYVEEFAKEKKIDILFGAMADGNLMAGSEKFDLTPELIEYVNDQYQDK